MLPKEPGGCGACRHYARGRGAPVGKQRYRAGARAANWRPWAEDSGGVWLCAKPCTAHVQGSHGSASRVATEGVKAPMGESNLRQPSLLGRDHDGSAASKRAGDALVKHGAVGEGEPGKVVMWAMMAEGKGMFEDEGGTTEEGLAGVRAKVTGAPGR